MQKFIFRLLPTIALVATTLLSCSDDDKTSSVSYDPPMHCLTVNDLQRTQTTFTIESPQAADYAYIIAEKDEDPITSAEEIFEKGTVGMLEEGTANITSHDLEGGKEYVVYSAVRRINPYVYSEVLKTDLSTNLPYADIVTLDKVGLTDITYHVKMPENAAKVKHVIVKEADYIAIKTMIGSLGEINEMLYLKVFGHTSTEDEDMYLDKLAYNGLNDNIHIHTGTTYYLMGGVVGDDGEIIPETFEFVKFDTRKAEEAPYNIDVAVTTSSTQATVSIVPDPEFVEYRVLVESRAEFDFALSEGEAQMRNLIVGWWDDEQNSPKRVHQGPCEFNSLGLIPNSEYVVGVIGYDAQRREKLIRYDFITGEPTGPKPTVTITEAEPSVEAPWSTKAYNVKATNVTEGFYGFFIKSQIDQLLHNGTSLANIVRANGSGCSPSVIEQLLSPEGATFEATTLQPQTEYMFAIYTRNDEYVTAVDYRVFTTDEMPQVGGKVRKNMPGQYTASTTDVDGNVVTFPVTIATGIDATTTAQYGEQNRLVAFGFGPSAQFPFLSPADLMESGVSMDDAYANYGPKWFIEFKSEDEIYIPNPKPSSSLLWSMGLDQSSNKATCMWGYGIRPSTGRDMQRAETFPVTVSDDGNTVTINGSYLEAQKMYYYPTMVVPPTGWGMPSVLFRCYSEIILTKQASASSAFIRTAPLIAPRIINLPVGHNSVKDGRSESASKFK